eukprot:XP_011662161.1 PREDICTED: uncharacterized protein LOC100888600 isoform X1 [Strongylocentrotus purpuratus]
MYDMDANLSTSVQDTDSDVSLKNLGDSKTSEREIDSDVSLINLKEMKRYQPLLREKGYNLVENASDGQVDDQLLAVGDPQGRAMNLGMSRMTLGVGLTNEHHYQAWLSPDSVQTDKVLQDELDETNDVNNQSSLEEIQPKCDLERNDFRDGERHAKAVGITKTRTGYTPKEQALLKKTFTQYTVCLEKILLSDGDGWSFLLDDIVKIICDLMSWLAGLHDKSIVYGDVRAGNIFINDHMKAFLISSEKSKEQNNEAALLDESLIDVKAMCKVMGGLYAFYMRMKPRDSQKKAETALFTLLRRGYRDGISAKDFLEVLRRIVVDVGEQEEAPQEEAPRQPPIKKISELGSAVAISQGLSMKIPSSEPRPEAVGNKVPLQASRDANNEGPGNKSMDKTSKVDCKAMEDHCSTVGATTHADRVREQKKAGAVTNMIPELGSAAQSQGSEQVPDAYVSNQVPDAVSNQVPDAVSNQAPDAVSNQVPDAVSNQVPDAVSNQVPDAVSNQVPDAVSNQVPDAVSNRIPDAVSNQAPVPASGANNEGPGNESRDTTGDLDSREMEDGYSTDGTSIHETLMADMEMEMFQSK